METFISGFLAVLQFVVGLGPVPGEKPIVLGVEGVYPTTVVATDSGSPTNTPVPSSTPTPSPAQGGGSQDTSSDDTANRSWWAYLLGLMGNSNSNAPAGKPTAKPTAKVRGATGRTETVDQQTSESPLEAYRKSRESYRESTAKQKEAERRQLAQKLHTIKDAARESTVLKIHTNLSTVQSTWVNRFGTNVDALSAILATMVARDPSLVTESSPEAISFRTAAAAVNQAVVAAKSYTDNSYAMSVSGNPETLKTEVQQAVSVMQADTVATQKQISAASEAVIAAIEAVQSEGTTTTTGDTTSPAATAQ